jgi:hypothetical protein
VVTRAFCRDGPGRYSLSKPSSLLVLLDSPRAATLSSVWPANLNSRAGIGLSLSLTRRSWYYPAIAISMFARTRCSGAG